MPQLLYIQGFQEDKIGKPIGPQIKDHCDDNSIDFHTIDFPGDTDSQPETESKFSLTALKDVIKEKIITILNDSKEDLIVTAYSLSACPAMDAITELPVEYKNRIKLKLIHPAINPLTAVQKMEWIRRRGKGDMIPLDNFLKGEPEVFKELILHWRGDSIEFSRNLGQDFSNLEFESLTNDIKRLLSLVDVEIYSSGVDMIIGENCLNGANWISIIRSHFPSKELLNDFFKSLGHPHP